MTFLSRQLLILILPALAVTTTFLAGANKGPVRIYWTLCAIGITFVQGFIHLRKEVVLRSAREEAIAARTNLAITVFDASQPVVAALQHIADADNPEDRRSAVDILIRCTVGLAHTQLGHQTGIRCSVRAAFYRLSGNRLIREYHQGRPGGRAPRAMFDARRSAEDSVAMACAQGEEALLEDDLENRPPRYMLDVQHRDYRSFISVPVRTPQRSFGMLTADSDKPHSLSDVDKGFLILLAGALAAGLAQLDQCPGNDGKDHQKANDLRRAHGGEPRPAAPSGGPAASTGGPAPPPGGPAGRRGRPDRTRGGSPDIPVPREGTKDDLRPTEE
jgi:putative methionine-R-sulfoxide reductase with GAF domain